jgi:hypothetical protein
MGSRFQKTEERNHFGRAIVRRRPSSFIGIFCRLAYRKCCRSFISSKRALLERLSEHSGVPISGGALAAGTKARGLTGMFLYADGNFSQILEGESALADGGRTLTSRAGTPEEEQLWRPWPES